MIYYEIFPEATNAPVESNIADESIPFVRCDRCYEELGNGDEDVFEVDGEVFCKKCFMEYALNTLDAEMKTAGEYADARRLLC